MSESIQGKVALITGGGSADVDVNEIVLRPTAEEF
jgi:hypothetical protein